MMAEPEERRGEEGLMKKGASLQECLGEWENIDQGPRMKATGEKEEEDRHSEMRREISAEKKMRIKTN